MRELPVPEGCPWFSGAFEFARLWSDSSNYTHSAVRDIPGFSAEMVAQLTVEVAQIAARNYEQIKGVSELAALNRIMQILYLELSEPAESSKDNDEEAL